MGPPARLAQPWIAESRTTPDWLATEGRVTRIRFNLCMDDQVVWMANPRRGVLLSIPYPQEGGGGQRHPVDRSLAKRRRRGVRGRVITIRFRVIESRRMGSPREIDERLGLPATEWGAGMAQVVGHLTIDEPFRARYRDSEERGRWRGHLPGVSGLLAQGARLRRGGPS